MAYVNYVREINAFHRFANINCLGSSERLLWFGLMDYINQTYASGADWPGEFISVPNKALLSHVPFGEDALIDARNRLKQRGLIEYNPGKKNQKAPEYRMHYFDADELSTGYQQNIDGFCTYKTGNVPCNVTGNVPCNVTGNVTGNVPGNVPDITPNVYSYRNQNAYANKTLSSSLDEIKAQWRRTWGKDADDREADGLKKIVETGYATGDILDAIHKAYLNADSNPIGYMIRLLEDWQRFGRPKRPRESREGPMQRYTPEERRETYMPAIVDFDEM
ncbi:MAG: hypothetical protein ACI4MM_08655 [Candidatus Ventricola sp.]